jgi:phosphoglucomutase
MPAHPVFVKTIVTMDLAEKIASHYGAETINVLTGFKFIGEVIGRLEAAGRESDYICGFEESYGYLTGTYVRDKDAVNAAFMICEMFAYYRTRGISLPEKLNKIYETYGYCMNTLHSYEFEGASGMKRMQQIMAGFRSGLEELGGLKIEKTLDYIGGLDGLPKSDVIKYLLEGGSSVVIRPSGTEPLVRVMIEGRDKSVIDKDASDLAALIEKELG